MGIFLRLEDCDTQPSVRYVTALGISEFRYGTQIHLLRWDPLFAGKILSEWESADLRREPYGTRRRRDVALPPNAVCL